MGLSPLATSLRELRLGKRIRAIGLSLSSGSFGSASESVPFGRAALLEELRLGKPVGLSPLATSLRELRLGKPALCSITTPAGTSVAIGSDARRSARQPRRRG